MSSSIPILLGMLRRSHMWATGEASSMWPILSLLTLEEITSTPHFSHVIPLCLSLLYFPQVHS